jgi:hypothetical protein
MKRLLSFFLILALSTLASSVVVAEPVARGFGFGGAMGMAFFPDMTGINEFMSENGLPSMGSFLVGAGGNAREGTIGDLVFGGVGWGLMGFSQSADFHAELISAGGGLNLGAAIGGDKESVLTIGTVIGAGANVFSLTNLSADPEDSDDVGQCGIIPGPTSSELVHVNGFVQPYVSMSAQLLPWMGFEFRLGYIFSVLGRDIGDLGGLPAPSLALSGPTVSLGLVFGGIGPSEEEREARRAAALEMADEEAEEPSNDSVTLTSEGSFVVPTGGELVIENGVGELTITSYAVDSTDAAGDLVVQWQALRTAKAKRIEELQAVVEDIETGMMLHSTGLGNIDYAIQIPAGVDLRVKNGVGNVAVIGHEAQTIIIENGVGEINLQSLDAIALIVAGGICEIELADVEAQTLLVDLGLGWINIDLPVDTSARLLATAGIGNVSLDRFPGMTGGVRGFIGKTANATLGHGEGMVELNVGLGDIGITMTQP